MVMLRLLAALVLVWLLPLQARALEVRDGIAELHYEVLHDGEGRLSMADLLSLPPQATPFLPLPGERLIRGYTGDAYWLRIVVRRTADAPREFRLEIRPAYLDDLRFYAPDEKGEYHEQRQGDRLPFSSRQFNHRNPLFSFTLPDEKSRTLYLRVQTSSSLMVLPTISPARVFQESAQAALMGVSFFLGMLAVMVGMNLLYAAVLRDRFFLSYAQFLLLEMLMFADVEGLLAQWVFPEQPVVPDTLTGLLVFSVFGLGLVLFRRVVRTSRYLPLLDKALVAMAVCEFIVALSSFGPHFYRLAPWGQMLLIPGTLIIFLSSLKAMRAGESGAGFIAAGYLCHLVLLLHGALSNIGLLEPRIDPIHTGFLAVTAQLLLLQIGILVRARYNERLRRDLEVRERAALERAANTQQLHEAGKRFLNMVAHEVRTPLAVIGASANSLRMLAPGTNDITVRIDRIGHASARLGQLFDLYLDSERIERECCDPQRETCTLLNLVAAAAADHGLEPGKRLMLTDATHQAAIFCDQHLLRVAISNLLGNAAKYAPADTPIQVFIRTETATDGRSGILLDVIDEGDGVPSELIERIFEKHFRANESSKIPGLGLGLYLVRLIAESHAGWVCAMPGPGGRFRLFLPLPNDRMKNGKHVENMHGE